MAEMPEADGLCIVYFWSSGDYGHISLQADGGPYISFWPKIRRKRLLESVPAKWYHTLHDEITKNGPPDETYYVTYMNIRNIARWWEEFTEKDPEWNIHTANCSDIVCKALCKGSDRFKGRVEGFATTPRAVAKLVKYDMNRKSSKIRQRSSCSLF